MCSSCIEKAKARSLSNLGKSLKSDSNLVLRGNENMNCEYLLVDLQTLLEIKKMEKDFYAVSVIQSAINLYDKNCTLFNNQLKVLFHDANKEGNNNQTN